MLSVMPAQQPGLQYLQSNSGSNSWRTRVHSPKKKRLCTNCSDIANRVLELLYIYCKGVEFRLCPLHKLF